MPTMKSVLQAFVSDVNATGGVVLHGDGTVGPCVDPSWTDLGATYILACSALKVQPVTIGGDTTSEDEEEYREDVALSQAAKRLDVAEFDNVRARGSARRAHRS